MRFSQGYGRTPIDEEFVDSKQMRRVDSRDSARSCWPILLRLRSATAIEDEDAVGSVAGIALCRSVALLYETAQ